MEVSTLCVVADNQSLIVLGALVVDHAAAQLLCVCPDHLGVVANAGAEPEQGRQYLSSVDK